MIEFSPNDLTLGLNQAHDMNAHSSVWMYDRSLEHNQRAFIFHQKGKNP